MREAGHLRMLDLVKIGVPSAPHSQPGLGNDLLCLEQYLIGTSHSGRPVDLARLTRIDGNYVQPMIRVDDHKICSRSQLGRRDCINISADSMSLKGAESQTEVRQHIKGVGSNRYSDVGLGPGDFMLGVTERNLSGSTDGQQPSVRLNPIESVRITLPTADERRRNFHVAQRWWSGRKFRPREWREFENRFARWRGLSRLVVAFWRWNKILLWIGRSSA